MNKIEFTFPLPRPHCGVVMGNGCFGALVWGAGNRLTLTVNRADFWDRRDGELIAESVSYQRICEAYDPDDPQTLRKVFRPQPAERPSNWFRSTRLPGGRFEFILPDATVILHASLEYATGILNIETATAKHRSRCLRLIMSPNRDLLAIEDPEHLIQKVKARPGWEWTQAELRAGGYAEPRILDTEEACGWIQPCPADPAMAAVCAKSDVGWACSLKLGADTDAALAAVRAELAGCNEKTQIELRRETREWWGNYWRRAPQIKIPDAFYGRFLKYTLYKFACATNPTGKIPAGLQGPWIEEYQTARWGGDYHFNVNIQQIYTLAFPTGQFEHLLPLFDMLESDEFQTVMRRNARILLEIDDGRLLTHTSNDRGRAVGGVAGPGCILDHAVLGWLAQLYWLYYQYTGNLKFLRERAWPFMRGTMRTYEAMLVKKDGRFHLPLGVSAEYRNQKGHSCGPNPSYQLACIHMLTRALLESATLLNETPPAVWHDIRANLPPWSEVGAPDDRRIAVWDNQDLDNCHRHHSHLAAIYPFDSLGELTPAMKDILENSIDHWILKGMGQWSEWCIPWAAIIQSRIGLSEAPLTLLEIWRRVFVNEGLATVYLPKFRGISAHRRADINQPREKNEIMQLDGAMSAATALCEMLVHTHSGLTRVFPAIPSEWRNASFKNIRLPGPFTISATRKNGATTRIRIYAPLGGTIRLDAPGRTRMRLCGRARPTATVELPITIKLRKRETVQLLADAE